MINQTSVLKTLEQSKQFHILKKPEGVLYLKKLVNGLDISVLLKPTVNTDTYFLSFPTYVFESKVSHFSPGYEENRFCRRKDVLVRVIRIFQRIDIWKCITNKKELLKVNSNNKRSNKKELNAFLKSLLSEKEAAVVVPKVQKKRESKKELIKV